ncbi:MAG: CRTAC1 family protein [Candidatus Latescibacteria bacterium]|nr:CRTAC1 family protein [Candidatus Latescibacterota bacterium]
MLGKEGKIGSAQTWRYAVPVWWIGAAWMALMGACARVPERPQLVELGEAAGVRVKVLSGTPEKRQVVECNTGGVALFDYDRDADLDIFVVNGWRLEGFAPGTEPRAALYRNEGNWHFTEVGAQAGVDHVGWGMGCTAVDYNADGWTDLYLTAYGRAALYRNEGGHFSEVGAQAGVDEPGWTTGAAFGDYDGDGDLDFYLVKYLEFDPQKLSPVPCTWLGFEVFCGPHGLPEAADRYFRNEGPGGGWRFAEISSQVGIGTDHYYGFGALALDFDQDADLDIYVANDSGPNLLYRNEGGRFSEVGREAGCAFSADGREQASMGIAAGDYDRDGDVDLVITNFSHDNNALYQNQGDGTFRDLSFATAIGRASIAQLGWGVEFFDWDNDGDEDLFVANGHVYPQVDQHEVGTTYAQANQLFENQGQGDFIEVSRQAGPGLAEVKSSRGTAAGDLDDDGDLDLVVVNIDDRPSLLRNEGGNRHHWLEVKLAQGGFNPQAIGARVRLLAGGGWQLRELRAGTGYLSQSDQRLHFGLGKEELVERLIVRWPDGEEEVMERVAADQMILVRRGEKH